MTVQNADDASSTRPPLEIAVLETPGYLPIDIINLQTAFAVVPEQVHTHLVWKNLDEIVGEPHFSTELPRPSPTPSELDVLCCGAVPPEHFDDGELLELLVDRGRRAGWIAGPCGGLTAARNGRV